MFRQEIRKTFMMLDEKSHKDQWKIKIDNCMGVGYTEKRL
jgi:hypothetical protein